jgi:hypothetical protein
MQREAVETVVPPAASQGLSRGLSFAPSGPVVHSRAELVGFLKELMEVANDTTGIASVLILFLNTHVKATKDLEAIPGIDRLVAAVLLKHLRLTPEVLTLAQMASRPDARAKLISPRL